VGLATSHSVTVAFFVLHVTQMFDIKFASNLYDISCRQSTITHHSIMLVFRSPNLFGGRLEFALTRKSYNQYALIFTRGAGMAEYREISFLNFTTSRSEKLALSADKHHLIWLDSNCDRDERNLGPPGGMLAALLAVNPAVIKATGRTRVMRDPNKVAREVPEVEILLSEEDLYRACYYCGCIESYWDAVGNRMERCGGQDHESWYWCYTVSMNMTNTYMACSSR